MVAMGFLCDCYGIPGVVLGLLGSCSGFLKGCNYSITLVSRVGYALLSQVVARVEGLYKVVALVSHMATRVSMCQKLALSTHCAWSLDSPNVN